jgi:hypothetical protein
MRTILLAIEWKQLDMMLFGRSIIKRNWFTMGEELKLQWELAFNH